MISFSTHLSLCLVGADCGHATHVLGREGVETGKCRGGKTSEETGDTDVRAKSPENPDQHGNHRNYIGRESEGHNKESAADAHDLFKEEKIMSCFSAMVVGNLSYLVEEVFESVRKNKI